jgi:hypothetical protein
LKKHELENKKKKQMNPDVSLKPTLIFQIHNLLNPRPELNQEAQLNDEGWNWKNKINLKNLSK